MATRAALSATTSAFFRSSPASKLVPRRGFAAGGDHHGPQKINIWDDPLSPSKWKDEHLVLASLTGWTIIIYGGYKLFSGEKKEEALAEPKH